MNACYHTDTLIAYEREQNRRALEDETRERIVSENEADLAQQLLRLPGWVAEAVSEGGDTLADLVLAIGHACNGDDLAASSMLRKAFEPAAGETAQKILSDAADEWIDGRWGRDYEPTSENVDIRRYES